MDYCNLCGKATTHRNSYGETECSNRISCDIRRYYSIEVIEPCCQPENDNEVVADLAKHYQKSEPTIRRIVARLFTA